MIYLGMEDYEQGRFHILHATEDIKLDLVPGCSPDSDRALSLSSAAPGLSESSESEESSESDLDLALVMGLDSDSALDSGLESDLE